MGGTVTSVANSTPQTEGGFLPPSSFQEIKFSDEKNPLYPKETISASLMGIAVDSMTRFMLSHDFEKSFETQIKGLNAATFGQSTKLLDTFKERITGIDTYISLASCCLLCTFEYWYRDPVPARKIGVPKIEPDEATLTNLAIMVKRSLDFFTEYGPVTEFGFTFEPEKKLSKEVKHLILRSGEPYGGYTQKVSDGDGDYRTADGLWDMKTSKRGITSKQTLQILMYWIMGLHSGKEAFQKVQKIGIFNPRLNVAYVRDVGGIEDWIVKTVEGMVIGYR